jgi:hypothetical protein
MIGFDEKLLVKYGFEINKKKNNPDNVVYAKDKFEVAIKSDGVCYYTNMGFDYPLKNEEDLLKIYFEVRREKLQLRQV